MKTIALTIALLSLLLPAFAGPTVVNPVIPGLIGHWTLNEGSGTVSTADRSGFGNTGYFTNSPAWTNGAIGSSLRFGPTTNFINCGSPSISAGASLTMAAWIYSETSKSTFVGILAKRPTSATFQYGLNFNNAAFQVYTSGGSGVQSFSYVLPTNVWTHVCGVIQASGPTLLYVNGSLFGSSGSGGGVSSDPGGYLMIGNSINDTLAEQFTGRIDDVRMYNRALTAQEIRSFVATNAAGLATPMRP